MRFFKFLVTLSGFNLFFCQYAFTQFKVDGQLIVRGEYRNGYNQAIPEGADPAGFIAHRARLQASYKIKQFNFFMSVQDVRTWGSTSQANTSDDLLSVHEAWGEFGLGDYWKIRLGRQELNYDNVRFLGNLDWALQARSHDFALAKYEKEKAKLHFGGGFNQDGQMLSGNIYTTQNQYKTAQMVRYENVIGRVEYSLLFWNEGRQYLEQDSVGNILSDDVYYRQTIGIPTLTTTLNKTDLSGYLYYQMGKDVNGNKVSAFNASAQVSRILYSAEKGKQWRATLGYEVISGTDGGSQEKNNSYTLQYGTNHLFNGYQDWFFVSNTWENSVGLKDIFLRTRYTFSSKFFSQLDYHLLSSYASPLDLEGKLASDKSIGSELDLVFGLLINDAVSLQGGYSQFFLSGDYKDLQATDLKEIQNWAYLMVIFRPTSTAKFIGILQ